MDVVIDGLRFARGGRTVLALDSLVVPHGATTALFGPNGSGKTTLLRLLAGLERPTAGAIRLGDAGPDRPSQPHRVALAFQQPVFLRGTVRRNVALGLELRGVPPEERDRRILEAARECGVETLLDRPARALSGGEAQRVNLARALCLRAPLTLLDEPLAGLDRVARARLLEDLPRLLQTFATTTVLVTHDREEAFRLADSLVVLVGGAVRAAGPKGEVYRRPPDALTAELLGYAVISSPAGLVAVSPGGFRPAGGADALTLVVERVVDMGNHHDVIGTVNGVRVSMRAGAGECAPELPAGARIGVVARGGVLLPRGSRP